nr:unnamed protein product [Callosobruchus analis]
MVGVGATAVPYVHVQMENTVYPYPLPGTSLELDQQDAGSFLIGLSYCNKKLTNVMRYLTYIFGVPLLNPSDVGDCFAIDLSAIQPICEKVTQFAQFLVQTYISEDANLSTLYLGRSFVFGRKNHKCLRAFSPTIQRILSPKPPKHYFIC